MGGLRHFRAPDEKSPSFSLESWNLKPEVSTTNVAYTANIMKWFCSTLWLSAGLCRQHCKYLRKFYIIFHVRDATLADGGQKRPEYRLKNQIDIIFFWNITSKYRCGFYNSFYAFNLSKVHAFVSKKSSITPYKTQRSFVFWSHTCYTRYFTYKRRT